MVRRWKDPVSALTHLVGALASVVGLVALLVVGRGSVRHVVAFAIFGASLVLLYTASTLYHALRLSERGTRIMRRIDHTMIFVLIAGTYTPFALIPLYGPWGWSILCTIWGLALAGFFLKLFWLEAPRWFSTLLYTLMGWLVVVAGVPLVRSAPMASLLWLLVGGIVYTVGAVFYAFKWPNPFPRRFGFHEIWHLMVMAGSVSHFWAIFHYLPALH